MQRGLNHWRPSIHLEGQESFVRGQSRGVQANEYDTLSITAAAAAAARQAEGGTREGARASSTAAAIQGQRDFGNKKCQGLITLFTGMPLFVKEIRRGRETQEAKSLKNSGVPDADSHASS